MPSKRFGEVFNNGSDVNASSLVEVICGKIDGCRIKLSGNSWEGRVKVGSGFIDIGVSGVAWFVDDVYAGDLEVSMSYADSVVKREKSRVRRVFGDIGLRKV